jgi:ATP-dependent exoDNAse (exonuclease V) alpha subunit
VVLENLPMCNKSWAYTAITRAKKEVKIVEITSIETILKQQIQPRIAQ